MANKHVALEAPETLQDRFRDAIAPRTLALGLGVLLLQLGFILSYLGAFHSPTPHRIPVEVVAPAQAAGQIVDKLNGLPGEPITATAAAGAYQPSVLPPFWRAISSFLPNGAGAEAIRRIVYFDGHGLTHSVVVLICWIAGGVLVTLLGAAVVHRGRSSVA